MPFGSDFPRLAQRILPVCPIERTKRAELEPTGIQLTPFLVVGVLGLRLVPLLLASHIPVLHTEAADIHRPIRNAAHGKVQPGGDLRLHVFPTGSDVPAPRSGGIALQSGKARTGQQEHTLVVVHPALAVIDSVGIHQSVSVEELGGRSQSRRSAQILAVLQVGTIAHVRLAGIHPPSIDAQRVIMLVHLLPEQFPCVGTISVIESVGITRTYPVLQAILYRLLVHPAILVKLLEMFGRGIELRPYRNHHPSVHRVDRVYHGLRVGETCLVELVASPSVFGPISACVLYFSRLCQ